MLSGREKDGGSDGRRRHVAGIAAAFVLAAAAGAWWWLGRSTPEPARRSPDTAASTPRPLPGAPTGTVEIDSRPAAASVAVDGRVLGEAPQRVELRGGAHEIRLSKDGFEPSVREVHVVPGHTVRVDAELQREAPRLRVDADVPGATVFLDREPIGRTPLSRKITPGAHRLNVTAEGYEMHSETIDVGAGTYEVTVRFKEVRLDETIEVVHKHGVGSCRGRLLATTEGLRYEAADSDHGFGAAFTRLEPLRTDYLARNLRVKLKGGKTYNFTAADVNALLSFEQKVEAARKRLSSRGESERPRL